MASTSSRSAAPQPGRGQQQREIVGLGFEKKPVANAVILSAAVVPPADTAEAASSRTWSRFEIPLRGRIITNKDGEFILVIPPEPFARLPAAAAFDLVVRIRPPQEYTGRYDSDTATVRLKKSDGPTYALVLSWTQDPTKSNKGTFAVSSKAQT